MEAQKKWKTAAKNTVLLSSIILLTGCAELPKPIRFAVGAPFMALAMGAGALAGAGKDVEAMDPNAHQKMVDPVTYGYNQLVKGERKTAAKGLVEHDMQQAEAADLQKTRANRILKIRQAAAESETASKW